jgi:hypothetical protein
MENISKTKTKHKGGRPRKHPEIMRTTVRKLNDGVNTERSINNKIYYEVAKMYLEDSEFAYLLNKKTILTALGRVVEMYSDGDEIVQKLARIICSDRMNTAIAIDYINKYRMLDEDSPKLNKHKISGTLKKIAKIIENSNFKEDEMQYFFFALKELAEENLPAEEEDLED